MTSQHDDANAGDRDENRRRFLGTAASLAVAGGLTAGYGMFAYLGLRFLYPTKDRSVGWQFLSTVDNLKEGEALIFVSPGGAKVVVARQGPGSEASDFIALSSVCPHLGCAVHWEPQNERFFCPCHNGVFTPTGEPVSGPPKAAGQALTKYPLRVEGDLIFVEVPLESVTETPRIEFARGSSEGEPRDESASLAQRGPERRPRALCGRDEPSRDKPNPDVQEA